KAFRLNGRLTAITLAAFALFFLFVTMAARLLYETALVVPSIDRFLSIAIPFHSLLAALALLILGLFLLLFANIFRPYVRLREIVANFWNQALLPAIVSPIIALHLFIFD